MTAVVPDEVIDVFQPRKHQITPCEAISSLVVLNNLSHILRGSDTTWYIDNTAALSSLIKNTSTSADLAQFSAITHLWLARIGCRCFFEYVESDANIADGLSRSGLADEWTCQQKWALQLAVFPQVHLVADLELQEAFTHLWKHRVPDVR